MRFLVANGRPRKLGLLAPKAPAPIPELAVPTTGPSSAFIDLDHLCPPVHNQGGLGSCASFMACTFFFEFLQRHARADLAASELAFYWWVRHLSGLSTEEDTGSSIADTVVAGMKVGFALATSYPYVDDDAQFKKKPPAEVDAEALKHRLRFSYYCPSIETIDASLEQGFPIGFGMQLTSGFEVIDGSGIYLPKGRDIGGHAMGVIGKDDAKTAGGYKGFYKVRNQWGEDWAQQGNLWVPKRLFEDGTADEAVTARRNQA